MISAWLKKEDLNGSPLSQLVKKYFGIFHCFLKSFFKADNI